jgi:hypothetical protein
LRLGVRAIDADHYRGVRDRRVIGEPVKKDNEALSFQYSDQLVLIRLRYDAPRGMQRRGGRRRIAVIFAAMREGEAAKIQEQQRRQRQEPWAAGQPNRDSTPDGVYG